MKTLSEIKDEYAREKHYDNWRQLFMRGTEKAVMKGFEETAERYAQEYYKFKAKDLLERAAERAMNCSSVFEIQESITETPLD